MDAIGQYCKIWEASEDKILRNPLITEAWRALNTLGRLDLKGLFGILVLQLIH